MCGVGGVEGGEEGVVRRYGGVEKGAFRASDRARVR